MRRPVAQIMAGSWPGNDIETAVRQMSPYYTVALSGGEIDRLVVDKITGEKRLPTSLDGPAHRRNWVVGVSGTIRQHLGLPMRRKDEGEKYWHFFARQPRWGGNLTEADVADLKYAEYAKQDWHVVRRILDESGHNNTKFLVALPTGYALGVFAGPFVISEALTQKLETEVKAMFTGPDALNPQRTVLQLDLPTELITYAMATPALRPRFADWAKRTLRRLVMAAPEGTSIALHLCWGDLHGDFLPAWHSVKAMVQFTHAITEDWPEDHPLLYVIMPFGAGKWLPSLRAWHYRWLKRLHLPAGTLLAAGILHKLQSNERAQKAWSVVSSVYAGPMAVGPDCGCGRCTLEEALYVCKQGEHLLNSTQITNEAKV